MDVIILGVFNDSEKNKLNDFILGFNNLEVVWEFEKYNIESSKGILLLKKFYNLYSVGILVEKERDSTFTSYPLIYDVSESYIMGSEEIPSLFEFLDKLGPLGLKKMIIAFADEWDENSLVRVEKCYYKKLKQRLNSCYVWCEGYLNLVSNSEIRVDEYPLILEVIPAPIPAERSQKEE